MYALCMIPPHRSPEIMEVEHLARCLGHRRCSVNVVFINNDDNPHSSHSGFTFQMRFRTALGSQLLRQD